MPLIIQLPASIPISKRIRMEGAMLKMLLAICRSIVSQRTRQPKTAIDEQRAVAISRTIWLAPFRALSLNRTITNASIVIRAANGNKARPSDGVFTSGFMD